MKPIHFAILTILFGLTALTSCSSRGDLYETTDSFVKELETKSKYGVFQSGYLKKTTKDGVYQVTPTGRLIIVKYIDYVGDDKYEDLKEDLSSYYSNDSRVSDVYMNRGGTVVIDCRD